MKKVIFFFSMIFLLFTGNVSAQEVTDDPFFRMTFNKEKRTIVSDFMKLTAEESDKFWPIYNEYEVERQKLGTTWLNLIEDYSETYETISDEKAKEMMEQSLALRGDILNLEKKYFKKLSKTLSPRKAAQWLQLEEFIITEIRLDAMDAIPFIGEQ